MQFVNDDMDEIFRRAAENYPLDTNSKDWNKVLNALNGNDVPPGREPKRKKDYRKFSWLLLLLPLYLICSRPFGLGDQKTAGVSESNSQETSSAKKSDGASIQNDLIDQDDQYQDAENQETISNAHRYQKTIAPVSGPAVSESADSHPVQSQHISTSSSRTSPKDQDNGAVANPFSYDENSASLATKGNNNAALKNTTTVEDEPWDDDHNIITAEETPIRSFYTKYIERETKENTGHQLNVERKDVVDANSKTFPRPEKNKKFYVGAMAGADITTIRFQKTEQAGFDYGLIAGYELNKKWSVEAAAFMTEKTYYTHGRYLHSDEVYRPSDAEITDVTGTCRMIDLSLGARYTFVSGPRSAWFATAGVSSYFMKKEDYSFTYYYPVTGYVYVHEATYKNESRNILSIANLSVGYSHRLGGLGQFRIEPYLKIPLRGVGFGELPMLSAGVRAGIVRKLF